MRRARILDWVRMRRSHDRYNDVEPSSPPQSSPDYTIVIRGYNFREGQGHAAQANLENPMLNFMRFSTARRNGKPRLRRMRDTASHEALQSCSGTKPASGSHLRCGKGHRPRVDVRFCRMNGDRPHVPLDPRANCVADALVFHRANPHTQTLLTRVRGV
jgi:hypothetical protein